MNTDHEEAFINPVCAHRTVTLRAVSESATFPVSIRFICPSVVKSLLMAWLAQK
jgi:hypothetical protein